MQIRNWNHIWMINMVSDQVQVQDQVLYIQIYTFFSFNILEYNSDIKKQYDMSIKMIPALQNTLLYFAYS